MFYLKLTARTNHHYAFTGFGVMLMSISMSCTGVGF